MTKLVQEELSMVSAINKYRNDKLLPSLAVNDILMNVARHRVRWFDHHAQGEWVWDCATRMFQYPGFCTDNLAQGYENGVEAVGDSSHGWGDEREGHTVGHDMQMKGFFKMNGKWVDYGFTQLGVASLPEKKNYIAVFGYLNHHAWGATLPSPLIKN